MLWYAKAFSKLLPIGPAAFVVGSGVERRRDRIHPDHSLRFAALWSRGNGHGTASNPFPETKIWTRISDNDAVTSWPERCHRLGGRCGEVMQHIRHHFLLERTKSASPGFELLSTLCPYLGKI